MANRKIIVKKELKSLMFEKTLVLAIIVQLFIASFSSLLVIGLASFFDPSALDRYNTPRSNVGIVGTGELKQFIEKGHIRPFYYDNLSSAVTGFYNNEIDAIIVIPKEDANGSGIIQIMTYLPKSDIKGTFAMLQLKKPLENYEAYAQDLRSSRLGFEPVRLIVDRSPKKTSTYFEFIYGILIPLLVFTPVFISGGMIIDMLTEEYERKTLDLLLVSPLSFSEILDGKMITAIIIVPAQGFLWLLLVTLNGVIVNNIGLLLLLSGIVAAIVVILGAIIAVRFKKRMVSQYLYSLVLIMLFLVGYLFANSPFNLATRLSAGSVGAEVLVYFGVYAAVALGLYVGVKRIGMRG
ncbi:MAG: ABC transporter permease [Candidatus Methanoperedens sp.]|nr:ABC transporter permease [Candidatus Methanoperedens sp.]